MDSVHFLVPCGAHTPDWEFKACVLGLWQDSVIWPLLWMLVSSDEAEITIERKLVAAAEGVIGAGTIRHLLVDRGYLDGGGRSCTRGVRG